MIYEDWSSLPQLFLVALIMFATETLAQFIVNMRFDQLPQRVIEQAKKCFLDAIGKV